MSSVVPQNGPLAAAYAACQALAQSHYENFPVASRLLPAPMRPHVAAVYAFARVADDIADEGDEPSPVRQVRLQSWQHLLHAAVAGQPLDRPAGSRDALMMTALAHTIRALDLPVSLFDDLVSAFGQDTMTTRYNSWAEVFDYCRRSANPVGRLVLRIAGYRDEALDRSSDALCTALQLTNFWQDFARDWQNGRLYVPRADHESRGAREAELALVLGGHRQPHASNQAALSAEWRSTLREMARRTKELFAEGRPVCDGVRGRLRYELRLTWHGGSRILERLEQSDFDVLHRPALGARDAAPILWRTALWSR